MLSGRATISTFTRTNMLLWMTLAFQAGLLNAAGLLTCHSFVSNMTGYATLFGQHVGQHDIGAAALAAALPIFFMIGAGLSGFLIDVRVKMGKEPKYYIVFALLFFLLAAVTLLSCEGFFGDFSFNHDNQSKASLLLILCLACGLQNGTVTLVSKSIVRTTHLTGLTTDLGIGLARVLYANRLKDPLDNEVMANGMRIGIIFCFILGSLLGYFLFEAMQYYAFLLPTLIYAVLLFLMIYFQLMARPIRSGR